MADCRLSPGLELCKPEKFSVLDIVDFSQHILYGVDVVQVYVAVGHEKHWYGCLCRAIGWLHVVELPADLEAVFLIEIDSAYGFGGVGMFHFYEHVRTNLLEEMVEHQRAYPLATVLGFHSEMFDICVALECPVRHEGEEEVAVFGGEGMKLPAFHPDEIGEMLLVFVYPPFVLGESLIV